jgi:hypothetical protein
MPDPKLDHPERPDPEPKPRRYAIIDRRNGAIIATHDDEHGAEREVIATGNPLLVILDLEQPPNAATLTTPAMTQSEQRDVLRLVEPLGRAL